MSTSKILLYDGSFNGFLTAVFTAYEEKTNVSDIQEAGIGQNGLFSETQMVLTTLDKAKRVWDGINAKSFSVVKNIYFAFLSEQEGIELLLYSYIKKLFATETGVHLNFADDVVLKVSQLAKMVGREKHRMEAFVRFQLTKDNIYFANIDPEFNVLPLISKHFRSRYADQEWIVYDVRRKYGLYYNTKNLEIIKMDLNPDYANSSDKDTFFTDDENRYRQLWQQYFKSTNIQSRSNKKLHTQHVPRRYWKYLSEKRAV
jgi:probable DNA metabolism protein